MFIVILRYIVSTEIIDAARKEHLKFLDDHYATGTFVASGMQITRSGGVIIAKSSSRKALNEVLKKDPFYMHDLAEYQIFEFEPTKYSADFKKLLETK